MRSKIPQLFKPMLKMNIAVVTVIILAFSLINVLSIIQTQRRSQALQTMALQQACQPIEDFIQSAEQLGIVVQNNPQLMAYSIYKNINLPHNTVWETEMLSPSVNSLLSLGIVYIDSIYPEINDLIYASTGRYTYSSYCANELTGNLTEAQLKQIVYEAKSSSFASQLSPESKKLLYVMPIPSQYLYSPGRMILQLDYMSFTKGLKALSNNNSDVYVYDNNSKLLLYFGPTYENDVAKARTTLQSFESLSGKVIFKYNIDKYGISIVQAIDMWSFYQPTFFALLSLLALAFIVTVLGLRLMSMLAQSTARPLEALVQRVSNISPTAPEGERDEIQHLSHVFEGLVKQQQELTTAMQSRSHLEHTQFLLSLLGCSDTHDFSEDIAKKHGSLIDQWASFGLRVLVFKFDDTIRFLESCPPKRQWSIKAAMRHEFDTMCAPLGFGEAVDLPNGQGIAAIAVFQKVADFARATDTIREALCRASVLSISCGISSAVYSSEALPKAFKEAASNCRYRLFQTGSTITPEYVASIRTQRMRLTYEGADEILQAVKNCNHPDISHGVGNLFADITQAASLPSYKLAYFDMLSRLNKLIHECSEKKQSMLANMLDLLYENCYESTDVLQKDLYEFCILLADTLYEYRTEHLQTGLLGTIYSHIEQNYASPALSLSSIAESLSFSPSYLTRFFKEKTGISLMQYIDKMRFEKSKTMLTSTSLPVKAIVEKVGYTDEANFSRKFRANEGVTPTQYRSMNKR